jgi:hypothetical protein
VTFDPRLICAAREDEEPASCSSGVGVFALAANLEDALVQLGLALVRVTAAVMWLGWCMWREPPVDRKQMDPPATA